VTLEQLQVGATGRLVRVEGRGGFRRRLLELGLLPGTLVRLVRRADVGGLIELEVRRSRVTLRRSEASLLLLAES
jgi:ferrous iron transport protein A